MDTPVVQPPIPQVTQPVPPRPKNNSGMLIGIFLLFLGILVGLGIAKTTILSNLRIPYLTATPTPTILPTPTADLSRAEPRDWKTYTSSCGFLVKYPEGWKAQKYFIEDKNTACAFLTSPDYKQGLDSRTGFWIEVTRLTKGTMNAGMKVNTVDDYLKSIEDSYMKSSIESLPPLNKEPKTYGALQGIQFDLSEFESISTFVFSKDNYLWIVKWPTATQYNGIFKTDLDQILSTFKFLDQNNRGSQTGGQQVNCPATRPEVCTMECAQPPPYICGSDGKSYCSDCQACSSPGVSWYVTQNSPCTIQ